VGAASHDRGDTEGKEVVPPPAILDLTIFMVATAIHFILSIVLALLFAFIAKGKSVLTAIVIGAIFGLVIYVVNFYGMTVVFPWFAKARKRGLDFCAPDVRRGTGLGLRGSGPSRRAPLHRPLTALHLRESI
jgi:uncharacterized membrane protein YgcG